MGRRGFTLIELMIVVAVIGVLAAVAIPKFADMQKKAREGATKGNLGALRSALSVYYGDLEGRYPTDDLSSMIAPGKFIREIPVLYTPDLHGGKSSSVDNNDDHGQAGLAAADTGSWAYWNDLTSTVPGYEWGMVWVGCTHTDSTGRIWTTY